MPLYAILGPVIAVALSIGAAWAKIRLSNARKTYVKVKVGAQVFELKEKDASKILELAELHRVS